jgi:hypothetical protein
VARALAAAAVLAVALLNVLAYRKTIRNVVRSPAFLFWNVEDWWLAR